MLAHGPAHAGAGRIAWVSKCEVFVEFNQLIGCCGAETIIPEQDSERVNR